MNMLERTMPTILKKRRVVFVTDSIWNQVKQEAETTGNSASAVVRKRLEESLR